MLLLESAGWRYAEPDAPVSEIGRGRTEKGLNMVLKFFHAVKTISIGFMLSALWLPTVQAADIQQLYLVRHAEKADLSKDPVLSACGQAQAAALATLLQDVNLPQLYHSGYQRTEQTAAASLKAGRQLRQYDAKDLPALAAQLRRTSTNALVVGHSNTTPQLATLLSQLAAPALQEDDYGRIYQLTRAGEQWSLQILQLPVPALCQR